MKRCYLGCSAIYFERGLSIPLLGVTLREGLAENFLLYLMNNHTIISCVYACKQSSHSRNSRRWVLIVQHAVGFFVTNIVSVLFVTIGIGAVYSQATAEPAASYFAFQMFDIFVTAPIAMIFGEGFRHVYRCDVSVATIEKYPTYVKALTAVRKGLLIPLIIIIVFCALVVCAILTTGQGSEGNVVNYMRDVFMVTVVLDLIYAALSFVSSYHYAVYLFEGRLCMLSIGQYYVELLLADGKKEGVDYKVSSHSSIGGLIRIDRVTDIDKVSGKSGQSTEGSGFADRDSFTQNNPMHHREVLRPAGASLALGNGGCGDGDSDGDGEGKSRQGVLEMPRLKSRYARPGSTEGGADIFQVVNPFHGGRGDVRSMAPPASMDSQPCSMGVDDISMSAAIPAFEIEMSGDDDDDTPEIDEEDQAMGRVRNRVVTKLRGRRESFVKNLVLFESRFGRKRLDVEGLSRSMVTRAAPGGQSADAAGDAAL